MELSRPPLVVAFALSLKRKAIVADALAGASTVVCLTEVDEMARAEALRNTGALLKDVSLANALGRELGMPMRLCNLTLAEMTEALARGWGARDSRVVMLLQQERAGVGIAVNRERLREALAPTVGKAS
jgi:3-hydroxyisobutyrate dehydrogenase-like beta-hydroxyacid dehydrogenase